MDAQPDPLSTAAKLQWEQVGIRPHHGINIPLFSLHSKNSSGIGEYPDLIPLIEWCAAIGMDIVQILPLNDPGKDSSPYNSLSAFALNPLFIGLSRLPHLENHPDLLEMHKSLQAYNKTPYVQYEEVRLKKECFLNAYWMLEYSHFVNTAEYQTFVKSQGWLKGYALFKVFKELYNNAYWQCWPEDAQHPSIEALNELYTKHEKRMSYYMFIQYLCHLQLKEVKEYASSKQVFLMGDIPILISPDSADVWEDTEHRIFNLDMRAGAPPDMYNKEGQYWGFPLYQWEQLEKDSYSWWKKRLQYASSYYHIYRIDHVVGFFRIWAIPPDLHPKEGAYAPPEKDKWIPHGRPIMEMMLASCPMLPIGEDLGVVPTEVRECLSEIGICGTKVMRWERFWEQDGSFVPIDTYPKMSLSTVSTHDSPTLTLWWRDFPEEAKRFCQEKKWTYAPEITKEQLKVLLRESHQSSSLFHVNLLNEYLAFFPDMVNSVPDTERINIPGKVLDSNWTYRFIPSVEEIAASNKFRDLMKELLS